MMQTLRRCSSLAETVVDYEDILIEILLRLPVRPLVRFKCVSKHWLFLISDPKFCHRHMLKNPHPPISAFFSQMSSEFGFVPLHFDHDPTSIRTRGNQNLIESARSCNPLNFVHSLHGIEIAQSCNGLFLCCLQPPRYSYPTTASTLVYYVLNPTTNKFTTLTPPAAAAATTDHPRIFGYGLAFDPSKSPHYKVVFLWFVNEPPGGCWYPYYHIEIYSSETRSWRLLDTSFDTHPDVFYNVGVYCNGAVHWVGSDGEMSYYHIDEERVGLVDGFTDSQGWNIGSIQYRYFRESHGGGQLHLIDIHRKCYTKFQVLETGKDYSGWSVKYNVDLDPLCTAYPHFLQNVFVVLSLAPEENEKDEESSSLLLHVPGKVISYNLRNSTFKSTDLTPKAGVDDSSCRIDKKNHRYVESLAVV
ncbi:PREDICTED: F-box protein At5g07610-like [Fragaria vesca subsp. vesca]|uniref:F-box protein At5g07610-like n=1 Tax=Fragaria vesca subsp. vesca TaxID=101020 RepID=UPI0002C2FEF2|nr:PREDICTED: F-box protein At5g07610-like [Fragaria vesca subsp. vesca]